MGAAGWGRIVTILPGETKWLHDDTDELGVLNGLGMLGLNKGAVADVAPTGVAVNALLRAPNSSPRDVADAAAFLLSEGAGYLHGITIALDGAQSPAMF
jgi:NAD(P)-dependent dehydrogenase (short-subunit alcohol dehydrogenase family)